MNLFSNPVGFLAVPSNISAGTQVTIVAASLSGLDRSSKYYFPIKATNVSGSSPGSALPFTTTVNLPTVTTAGAAFVSAINANLSGSVTNTGGAAVTERGIVWALNRNPTVYNNKIIIGTGAGDGTIRLNLANDIEISPSVSNKPFQSFDLYTIDKTAPVINLISVPDKSMKIDDTVLAIIRVNPDPDIYTLEGLCCMHNTNRLEKELIEIAISNY